MDYSRIFQSTLDESFSKAKADFEEAQNTFLKRTLIRKSLKDIDAPAAVLDLAVLRRNCSGMLDMAKSLNLRFRAHIKTHKTRELTSLQVGSDIQQPVNLIVSTLAELEFIKPLLLSIKATQSSRPINVVYGMPAPPSTLQHLFRLSSDLGPGSVSLLIDHADALTSLEEVYQQLNSSSATPKFGIIIKIDTGYHRAGLSPTSKEFESVLAATVSLEQKIPGLIQLQGFYSHTSLSYASSSPESALAYTTSEISGLYDAVTFARKTVLTNDLGRRRFLLSFGATPSATAVQRLLDSSEDTPEIVSSTKQLIASVSTSDDIELHAGVYTTLDLQQLASHARNSSVLNTSTIALRILVEVSSIYTDRSPVEVLVTGGTIALGREPCKAYPGWAVVTSWPAPKLRNEPSDPFEEQGGYYYVDRISQEHGILKWEGRQEERREVRVGEKLLVWPNHACIASAAFGYYVIVDSEEGEEGARGDEVVDVWMKGRGW